MLFGRRGGGKADSRRPPGRSRRCSVKPATLLIAAAVLAAAIGPGFVAAQAPATKPPGNPATTPEGKPNLQGYWNNQAGAAPWDIEPHPASFQVPPWDGVIVDPPHKPIPYPATALE